MCKLFTVFDNLLTSLDYAEQNAEKMFVQLKKMKERFTQNPTL